MLTVGIGTLALLFGSVMAWGQSDMKNLEDLKSGESAKRMVASQSLCQARQYIISALITAMDGTFPDDVKIDNAKVLGEYRAAEAVDSLVRNLELDLHPRILKGLVKDADLHPISQALCKIGKPAIPALLTRITEANNSALIERCARVCVEIEGREAAEILIQRSSDKLSAVDVAKQRLKQALDVIQQAK
jgi:hypothetical protein